MLMKNQRAVRNNNYRAEDEDCILDRRGNRFDLELKFRAERLKLRILRLVRVSFFFCLSLAASCALITFNSHSTIKVYGLIQFGVR